MTRIGTQRRLALVALTLLGALAAPTSALHAQATVAAATLNPAIFSDPAGSVVYAGNFRHFAAGDNAMSHGYLALSLSPLGTVTGTLTWHGTTTALPLRGKLDVATGQGHFSQRDASGKKVADAMRIPFLVSKSGLVLNGGGMAANGESTTFFLTKYDDGSSGCGDEGGGVLTLSGSSSFTGSSLLTSDTLAAGSVNLSGANTTAVTLSGANFGSATVAGATLTNLNLGTLTLSGASSSLGATIVGNITIAGNVADVAVVNGDLTDNGVLLLHGPLTTAINAAGATVYTGTNSLGTTATVTVQATPASTGG